MCFLGRYIMNKVILKGRFTKDPEVRNGGEDNAVVMFTLAVDRKGAKEKSADFIGCKAFKKTADFIGKYFEKGKEVLVEGSINTGSYEKEGEKKYTTDVIVRDVYFTGSKSDSSNSDSAKKEDKKDDAKASSEEELGF